MNVSFLVEQLKSKIPNTDSVTDICSVFFKVIYLVVLKLKIDVFSIQKGKNTFLFEKFDKICDKLAFFGFSEGKKLFKRRKIAFLQQSFLIYLLVKD